MKELTRQVVVRVDEQMYGGLVEDAECSGRTVAQTVRFMLRHSLDGVVCARCGAALRGGRHMGAAHHQANGDHCSCWQDNEKPCCACAYNGDEATYCTGTTPEATP